jgi:hypothetical protein
VIGAVSRLRFPMLALGLASLFFGVWAGLLRFGWSLPAGRANLVELHGPLMVFSRSPPPTPTAASALRAPR